LDWVLSSQEMDQFKYLLHDSDSNLLFTVASATGCHEHIDEALDNWARHFLEFTLLVASGSVRDVNLLFNSLDLEV